MSFEQFPAFGNVPMTTTTSIDSIVGSSPSSGDGYTPYASAISTVSNVMADIAATKEFEAKLKAKTDAAIASMRSSVTSFEFEQMKLGEQISELNETLGDKLSERGLQAIRNEAMIRAASAETGTSGGTTDLAIQEAFMTEHFDRANIISESKAKQRTVLRTMDASTVKLQKDLEGISSGMPVVKTNPLMSALSGGLNVFTGTLGMMPNAEKAKLFGIEPTGA